ncbi:MAG: hypothetical protein K0S71_2324 [Clostridia bacterium]|jgi:hypothetical protein|nr:hypothetical protein [Clostridia bacterium]
MRKSKILDFGNIEIKFLCKILFFCSAVAVAIGAFRAGYITYISNTYEKALQTNGQLKLYTVVEVNNLPLGILYGLLVFGIGLAVARIVCEIVYIILQFLKSNTKEDREYIQKLK